MGFGILFLACFFTFVGILTPLSAFTYVIGSALMLYALYKLSEQNKMFLLSAIGSFVLFLVSLATVFLYVFGIVSVSAYSITVLIQSYLTVLIAILLLIGIYLISKEVELKKIQARAVVNIIFVAIYFLCDVISSLVKSEEILKRIGLIGIISEIIYIALILINVFNCYMRICYEDDKDMSKSTTGVPVLDFLNKMYDKATKGKKNEPRNKGGK